VVELLCGKINTHPSLESKQCPAQLTQICSKNGSR